MDHPPLPPQLVELLNANRGGFNEALGLRFVSATFEEVVAEVTLGPEHRQPYGIVHGGVHSSIVETLCSTGAALHAMSSGGRVVGLENNTSFLKAARGGVLRAVATPLATGRRSHVWRAEIRDEAGTLLATGRVRLIVLEDGATVAGKPVGMESND